ncbi:unnamed protein product, partial [marine sediment metagenome]
MDCIANILDFYNMKSKSMKDDLPNFNKVWFSN